MDENLNLEKKLPDNKVSDIGHNMEDNGIKKSVKIIGFGNLFMGDDGIGIKVIEELKNRDIFRENNNVEIIDGGTSGVDLIFILQNADKAIIIDAVDSGQKIGEISVFSIEDIKEIKRKNKTFKSFSMHDMDLAEVFELIKTLNMNKIIRIIGINPKNIGYSDKLSPEIENKIPEIIKLIEKEI